ncbi:MAG: hypothetical protein KBT01_08930, partial [Clostridiales bacterium]|nr:hypothetical protein [Candidatus Blautia equi]
MVCISTVSAFGRIGSYVILVAFTVICLIWITQKSLIVFIDRMYMRCRKWLKGGQRYYQDSSEERALKRELKSKKREQDRQSRIEEIEREMAELDAMPEEEEFHVPVLPSKKNAPKVKREKAPEPQMPEEGEQLELNFDEEEEPEATAKPKVKKKNSVAGLGGMLKKPKRPRHEEADADEEENDEIAEIR